jgi:uncharacterized membrane protein|tara:strand:+ start:106 stop:486 length:381 start_codon:yes stop_codon:yes gene_type:complete
LNILHPNIVHFPIALICIAFFLHTVQILRPYWMCRVIGIWLLGLSISFSFLASFSGNKAALSAEGKGFPTETLQQLKLLECFADIFTWSSLVLFILWIYFFSRKMENKQIDYLAFAFLGLLSANID